MVPSVGVTLHLRFPVDKDYLHFHVIHNQVLLHNFYEPSKYPLIPHSRLLPWTP